MEMTPDDVTIGNLDMVWWLQNAGYTFIVVDDDTDPDYDDFIIKKFD
jgi:hypothetical protein